MDILAELKKSTMVHLCLAISFFTSGLIINIVQGILFYGLKPFNKRLYRQIGYYLCYSFYSRKYTISRIYNTTALYSMHIYGGNIGFYLLIKVEWVNHRGYIKIMNQTVFLVGGHICDLEIKIKCRKKKYIE